ncbi:MAG: glycerol-3-phosphate dehydrogenase/oxidase [Deltaproteobacteria bacterium]|nr:glycerol-3-phosphate dehydrogenase/oxidase [Deltaproteobacteria bacterium]
MSRPVDAQSPDVVRLGATDRLVADGVDLVVVGGGITGAGAARDAALRGLRTLIVDKGDWGNGTSSRSSKLVHGGLRYLETFQFGLVMEGTRERHRQMRLNPHLVEPLPFVMPVFADGRHGLGKINLGLWLYDLLSLFRTYKFHTKLKRDRCLATVQPLRADKLQGGILYYDCRTDDARLTLANVLAAERSGATALAQARYDGPIIGADGRVEAVKIHDAVLGRDLVVGCSAVLHATGPWTDATGRLVGDAARLRPTKGVHVVLDRERLPLDVAVATSSVDDGRVVFAIPFGNTTYVGTTDTDYTGDLEHVYATDEDVAYLLRTANHFFPGRDLAPRDVRSTWAGLRPLIRSDADTAYKTSREHEIFVDPRGLITIAGGKLTTYRAMAEEVVDRALKEIRKTAATRGRPAPKVARCKTHKTALDAVSAAPPSELDATLRRSHGSLAERVRERLAARPEEGERVVADLPYVMAQVAIAAAYEHAWHLEDVMVRRFQISLRSADCGLSRAPAVARLMADVLGRDEAWVSAEVAAYAAHVERSLACVTGGAERAAPAARPELAAVSPAALAQPA